MFVSLFLCVMHMELCKLMQVVVSTLKSRAMEIAQQSDAIWKVMVHFEVKVITSNDHLLNPNPY
jgi:hypothetical protein